MKGSMGEYHPYPNEKCSVRACDFRPISLINYTLKIISKLLSNHLSNVINYLVDNYQLAFIKGKSIADNIVSTEKLIFSIQRRNLDSHILKVDFVKTF